MSTDRHESRCKDCIVATKILLFFQKNKKGLKGQLQSLLKTQMKFPSPHAYSKPKQICTLPISSIHLLLHNLKTALQAK